MKIIVLGASGLLGFEVFDELNRSFPNSVLGTSTKEKNSLLKFDSSTDRLSDLVREHKPSHVVNCIGLIPQKVTHLSGYQITKKMILLNSLLPRELTRFAQENEFQLIQIRTDCVFSGRKGNYSEKSRRVPNSVYGISKFMGEARGQNQNHIRTSIIGHKPLDSHSLFGWFKNLPESAVISGFTNHLWNGVPTSVFARLSSALIAFPQKTSLEAHLVPSGWMSKYDLLVLFQAILNRHDVKIVPVQTSTRIDRRLSTIDTSINEHLWQLAGFQSAPDIRELIEKEISEQLLKHS